MNEQDDPAGHGYVALECPAESDPHAKMLFEALDIAFADMHRLLVFRRSKDCMPAGHRWATPLALIALTDTCANLFWTGQNEKGKPKFESFVVRDYRWDLDPPENITPAKITDLMWNLLRGPLVHRLGLTAINRRTDTIACCEMAVLSTTDLGKIERMSSRPWQASVSRDLHTARVTVHMEGWYWGLRKSVTTVLNDAARLGRIIGRFRSGAFDPSSPRSRSA